VEAENQCCKHNSTFSDLTSRVLELSMESAVDRLDFIVMMAVQ